ncbi:hypothetical protein Q8A67_025789 [Cirrhinus molitorella]|uniref:Uncharacterized protein n=1 Tax=Cirrhinus molitorella TaxID=172907 RepID=A0AA88T8L0_9TELE|nr:hypothetical protein Q8A67_025789 [Cirrhinus molitorella]
MQSHKSGLVGSSSFRHSHRTRGASPELNGSWERARVFREEEQRSRTGGSAGLLRSAAHQTDCRPSARIRQPASAQPPSGCEKEREGKRERDGRKERTELVTPLVALHGRARPVQTQRASFELKRADTLTAIKIRAVGLQSISRSIGGRAYVLSFSLEFLHFILRFWNQIFTCGTHEPQTLSKLDRLTECENRFSPALVSVPQKTQPFGGFPAAIWSSALDSTAQTRRPLQDINITMLKGFVLWNRGADDITGPDPEQQGRETPAIMTGATNRQTDEWSYLKVVELVPRPSFETRPEKHTFPSPRAPAARKPEPESISWVGRLAQVNAAGSLSESTSQNSRIPDEETQPCRSEQKCAASRSPGRKQACPSAGGIRASLLGETSPHAGHANRRRQPLSLSPRHRAKGHM